MNSRASGILLHPTSLPGGTLVDAVRWLDFMQASGFCIWQVLPLGVPLIDRSPYQCASAFAVNPDLFPQDGEMDMSGFANWCQEQAWWLHDYARFAVIKRQQNGTVWTDWPEALRNHDQGTLADLDCSEADRLQEIMRAQYRAHMFWCALRANAAQRGIKLFGDMPLFIAHDSADVWAHRHLFRLDDGGTPSVVAGVPPDYFSETGQRWGNPHYDWAAMEADGYSWWRARLEWHFEWFDLVRIDHFRGLAAAWVIPASEETAINGQWEPAPGEDMLNKVLADTGELPLVAEDLGIITDDVTALRKQFGFPGMAVLHFGFDGHTDNPHRPENVQPATVFYAGTHDNDTTLGWWHSLPREMQTNVRRQLGLTENTNIVQAIMETVLQSRANMAILTMQDILELGTEARMNTPGTTEDNWLWQFRWNQIDTELAQRLHEMNRVAERCRLDMSLQ